MKKSIEFEFSQYEIDNLFEIDAINQENMIRIYDITKIDVSGSKTRNCHTTGTCYHIVSVII